MSPALPRYDRTMSIQRRQTAPDRALDDAAHVLGGRDRSAVFQEGKGQRLDLIRNARRLTPKSKALIRKAPGDMWSILSNSQSVPGKPKRAASGHIVQRYRAMRGSDPVNRLPIIIVHMVQIQQTEFSSLKSQPECFRAWYVGTTKVSTA